MHNFTDAKLNEACHAIATGGTINWLVMKHHGSQDNMSLVASGSKGASEFRNKLKSCEDLILFGYLRTHTDQHALITWVPGNVSPKRKTRAKKRGKALAKLLKHDVYFTATAMDDVSDTRIGLHLERPDQHRQPSVSSSSMKSKSSSMSSQSEVASPEEEALPLGLNPFDSPTVQDMDDEESYVDDNDEEGFAEDGAIEGTDDEREDDMETQARELTEEEIREIQMAEEEKKRFAEEKQRLEEEERKRDEKKMAMKRRAEEIEMNHKIDHSGYVALHADTDLAWKHRYFILRGQNLMLYYDEAQTFVPVAILDLSGAKNFFMLHPEGDCPYIRNGFSLDTNTETYQMYTDSCQEVEPIMKTFQQAVQIH